MKHTILVLAFVLTANAASVFGQAAPAVSPTPAATATKQKVTIKTVTSAQDYDKLVAKAKGGDLTIDFALLRLSYTETKQYSPYSGAEERNLMYAAFNKGSFEEVITIAQKRLESNFVDPDAHFYSAVAYNKLGNTKQFELHRDILNKLVDAIYENDGTTPQTGMIAVGISEQYFVISFGGYKQEMKTLEDHGGSKFDVHHAVNQKTGEKRKFYFNIDKVFGRF